MVVTSKATAPTTKKNNQYCSKILNVFFDEVIDQEIIEIKNIKSSKSNKKATIASKWLEKAKKSILRKVSQGSKLIFAYEYQSDDVKNQLSFEEGMIFNMEEIEEKKKEKIAQIKQLQEIIKNNYQATWSNRIEEKYLPSTSVSEKYGEDFLSSVTSLNKKLGLISGSVQEVQSELDSRLRTLSQTIQNAPIVKQSDVLPEKVIGRKSLPRKSLSNKLIESNSQLNDKNKAKLNLLHALKDA